MYLWKIWNNWCVWRSLVQKASAGMLGSGLWAKTRSWEQKILFSQSTDHHTYDYAYTIVLCEPAFLTQGLTMTVMLSGANSNAHMMPWWSRWFNNLYLITAYTWKSVRSWFNVCWEHKNNVIRYNSIAYQRRCAGPEQRSSSVLNYGSENSQKFHVNGRY